MVRLIVTPIDPAAPGSWRLRKRFRQIQARLHKAQRTNDPVELAEVLDEAEDFVVGRLQTEDGSDLQAALDQLSANDFDSLLSAAGGQLSVPPASKPDSTPAPAAAS